MSVMSGSGVLPSGFKAAGISARIKKSGKKDLALFYSQTPCVASALFTANRIKAAPLRVTREHLRLSRGDIRAVIVNSANANCMTGQQGERDAARMADLTAEELSLFPEQVLVSSTGVIGKPMPMGKVASAMAALAAGLSSHGLKDAAEAILTTDTFPKTVSTRIKIGSRWVTISGVAKGAGMIAPRLKAATMLAYIFTDASVAQSALDKALRDAVGASFNAVTVDGCMSTNDTVVVMANGNAGNRTITLASAREKILICGLTEICAELARMIVRDAEGATKFIQINVRGARTVAEAENLAFSVANSNLFKCAMFGSDPNWGRIAAALGSVSSGLRWERLDIYLNKKAVFKSGRPAAAEKKGLLRGRDVRVDIDLHEGYAQRSVYTCDLSYGYVRINAAYN